MAAKPFQVLRNGSMTVAGIEFANKGLMKARLTPDVNAQTYRSLDPTGIIQDVDSAVWSLELQALQDWGSDGLAYALNAAFVAGTALTVVLKPKLGTGYAQATVSVTPQPVDFGGDVGEFADFEITLGVNGQPTFGTQS